MNEPTGATVWVYFPSPAFWRAMLGDLLTVVENLERSKGIPARRVVPVGASVGANVALNAVAARRGAGLWNGTAASRPDIPAVVALSPGLNYAGIGTEAALSRWDRPALLVACRLDGYAFSSVERLARLAPAPSKIQSLLLETPGPQGAHGTQLFDGKLEDLILDWIKTVGKF